MAKMPNTVNLQAESEDAEDGFSTDMGDDPNQESKIGCTSCSACCVSKTQKKLEKVSGHEFKKPTSMFGTKSFGQVCRETQK